jgi:PEP-CTERM motif
MRRVILLALLALAVPTATFATSIGTNDYSNFGAIGTTASVTGSATTSLTISSVLTGINTTFGNLGTVTVSTGAISGVTLACPTGGCFTGTLSIVNSSSVTLFSSSITGNVSVVGSSTFVTYTSGGIVGGDQISHAGDVSGDTIVTPEPGTLGLLGTGLVGLAGIVRRKLRS